MADPQPLKLFTRRDLLKGAGLAGAAAVGAPPGSAAGGTGIAAAQAPASAANGPRTFEYLSSFEADVLQAIVARLIPSDEFGPGAKEAGAAFYIDRALGGALTSSRQAYAAGLAGVDQYARATRGRAFVELPEADQDAVLSDVESGAASKAPGVSFGGDSAQFFDLVLAHTRQGTFGDPYYGGNANFVGWDLLRYPGVRTAVSAADQQAMEKGELKPARRSAYELNQFNKATVRADGEGGGHAD